MKTILSAVQTWTKGKIKDSTADWNQNDSGADSFVKNRTHWEEKWTKVLVDNLTSKEYEAGNISKCNFIPGNKYTVIWNDITYTDLVCRHDGDYNIIADDENKYPFYIDDDGGNGLFINTEDKPYTVSIIEDGIKVHKLDKKYLDLPDNIATTDNVESAKQEALDLANEAKNTADTALTNAATAQTTADTALANAATAQNTADAKMNKENPIGSGSFSMNRYIDSDIGDYSMTSGYGSVANHFAENVSGQYNVYEHPNFWIDTLVDETYTTPTFFKGYNYYYSNEYSFDQSTGIYKLINATYVSKDDISHLDDCYIILVDKLFKPYITEGSQLMFVSGTYKNSTNYYKVTGKVSQSVPDTSKKGTYTHIVGNGTSDAERSNAHTLDWEGNAWYSGDVYVGSTSGTNRDEGSKKLATVEEVQELASQISSQPYVVQAEEPEDKKLFWVDLDDDTEDPELNEAIEAAIAEAKAASIPVPNVAEIGQTIVVKNINESGRPVEWEVIDLPTESKWTKHFTVTLTEPVANVVVTMPEKYSEVYASINATFSSKPFVDADGNLVDGVVDAGWDNGMGLTSEPLMINVSMNQWTGAWGWVMSTPIYMPSGTTIPGIEPTPYIGFCGQKGSGSINQPSAIYMHAYKSGLHHADIKFVPRNGLQFNTGLSFIVWCR